MIRFITLAAASLASFSAWAGCANFDDGSLAMPAPVVEICFKGECEKTAVVRTCANSYFTNADYANGWSVKKRRGDRGYATTPRNHLVDASHVQCREIDSASVEPVCRF